MPTITNRFRIIDCAYWKSARRTRSEERLQSCVIRVTLVESILSLGFRSSVGYATVTATKASRDEKCAYTFGSGRDQARNRAHGRRRFSRCANDSTGDETIADGAWKRAFFSYIILGRAYDRGKIRRPINGRVATSARVFHSHKSRVGIFTHFLLVSLFIFIFRVLNSAQSSSITHNSRLRGEKKRAYQG